MKYLIIAIGIIATAFAAIFIKMASDAPALTIAAYRLGLATLIMTPYAYGKVRAQRHNYSAHTFRWNLLSGFFLACHFATWIASLKYTTVARSVLLVTTNPIFVAILGWIFLKEKLRVPVIFGIFLCIGGTIIMSLGTLHSADASLTGDLLALSGAFFASSYFLTGRMLRQTLSAAVYSYITYGTAAILLIATAFIFGLPWTGFSSSTYLMFFLLAVIPQIIGHTSFNYALRYVPAVIVAIAILGEPIGASALAWILLDEPVGIQTLYGGIFILVGVFVAVYTQEKTN